MTPSLNIEAFREAAQSHNLIPIYVDLMADSLTPVSAYARLRSQGTPSFLLESVTGGEKVSRYSFLGSSPRKIFKVFEDETEIWEKNGSESTVATPADPLDLIEEEMAQYNLAKFADLPPFIGGAMGGIAYEYIHRVETTVPRAEGPGLGTPLLYYMITDSVVVFENAHVENDIDAAYATAIKEIEVISGILNQPCDLAPLALPSPYPAPEKPVGNFTQERFENAVDTAKEYIRSGDIFQVVLSQRFEEEFKGSPLDLYRVCRLVNPSPYMFVLEADDFALVGASPEVHFRLQGEQVTIRPIAGTRPRGKTEEEDAHYAEDLLADEKERAEHLMLVDLARNDIGRVSQMGSVSVEDFMTIERYSHVIHIVSQTIGKIAPEKNAYDVMRATFPAGTVSGAPKVRAMQIISDYEKEQRGFYSGAVGYFSYDGSHDSAIALRTAVLKNDKVYIQAGAGVVADSDPHSEYMETINKSRALAQSSAIARELL